MATSKLSIRGDLGLSFFVQNDVGTSLRRKFGVQSIGEVETEFALGGGDGQCNWVYWSQARSLAATTFDTFDLYGALVDPFGATISAATLKFICLSIHSPDGTKSLRVGPQNQTGAAQLGWGGTGATVYDTVLDWYTRQNSYAGWSVTATAADKVLVYNPGGSAVTYSILLAGD